MKRYQHVFGLGLANALHGEWKASPPTLSCGFGPLMIHSLKRNRIGESSLLRS
jgi:hypothetical protein